MNDHAITAIVSVVTALLGLAIIAVLVSQSANTTGVFTATGGAIQQALCTALSPVTGGSCGSLAQRVTSTISYGGVVPQ